MNIRRHVSKAMCQNAANFSASLYTKVLSNRICFILVNFAQIRLRFNTICCLGLDCQGLLLRTGSDDE